MIETEREDLEFDRYPVLADIPIPGIGITETISVSVWNKNNILGF